MLNIPAILKQGVAELSNYIDTAPLKSLELIAVRGETDGYEIDRQGDLCKIVYHNNNEFFRALATVLCRKEQRVYYVRSEKRIRRMGVMLDCARNAVPKIETVKAYIARLALLGYDYMGLYVEDCFELKNYPIFGYMRGGYTVEELKEINRYGEIFGVEIMPFIQTLGHIGTLFRHEAFKDVYDIRETFIAYGEKTYALIEEMLRVMRECFPCKRINIGMDEAYMSGRGNFIDKYGYRDGMDIFKEHLKKTAALCKKYGFEASIWSDRFIGMKVGPHHILGLKYDGKKLEDVPDNVNFVYWDYSKKKKEYYLNNLEIHEKLFDKFSFAGGAPKWLGFAPFNKVAILCGSLSFAACVEKGVQDYVVTAWGDNGAECSLYGVLPAFANLARLNYSAEEDLIGLLTGYTFDEFIELDNINDLHNVENGLFGEYNPSKYLLYEDVLTSHPKICVFDDYEARYVKHTERLLVLKNRLSPFAYLFETLAKLSRVLELKSTLAKRIKDAYDGGDKEELKRIATERIPETIARIDAFYETYRQQWLKENKIQGLEMLDFRFGGLKRRLSNAGCLLKDYIEGNIDSVQALEEKRIQETQEETCFLDAMRLITYGEY